MSDKTFTVKEIESLLGTVMKKDSPLSKRIVAKFKNTSPEVEAKEILDMINLNRFNNCGFFSVVKGDMVAHELDNVIHIQAMISYDKEYGIANGTQSERDIFENGYRIGTGAVALNRLHD